MRIKLTSIMVDDQTKALRFYTDVLGFVKKNDIPMGPARWLTVVSPDAADGTELLLEPSGHPAVPPYKTALVEDGIPAASFAVDDVQAESDRLRGPRRAVHPGAPGNGRRDDRRLRRHLRQPDPDRAHQVGRPSADQSRGRARPSLERVISARPARGPCTHAPNR